MVDKAFAERIANTHYNEVFSFCLTKLQNKTEAEDLTQDTFLAFQIKMTVDGLRDDHVIAWLINTANNLIKHYFRDHKRFIMEELNESHLSVEDILECLERENPITPEQIEEQKQQVLSWILGFGNVVKVLNPPELVKAVKEKAMLMLKTYE